MQIWSADCPLFPTVFFITSSATIEKLVGRPERGLAINHGPVGLKLLPPSLHCSERGANVFGDLTLRHNGLNHADSSILQA